MRTKFISLLLAIFALCFMPSAYAAAYGEVQLSPSYRASYSCSSGFFNTATSATDVWTITGSASKTINILDISFTKNNYTGGSNMTYLLLKRSSADTSGTSSNPAIVSLDSANATATAVVRAYTANPSTGTLVGTVNTNVQSSLVTPGPYVTMFHANNESQALVLRGTSEVVALNYNGVTDALGPNMCVIVTWTEQ